MTKNDKTVMWITRLLVYCIFLIVISLIIPNSVGFPIEILTIVILGIPFLNYEYDIKIAKLLLEKYYKV